MTNLRNTDDDRGMMSMVMMVMIIGMGLAALLTPLVVTQSRSTSQTDARVQALHGAEAGINVTLGRLRNASSDAGVSGSVSLLPCYSGANPLVGSQPGFSSTSYSVTVAYYGSDPLKALAATGLPPSAMNCVTGIGPTQTGVDVPSVAVITSTGSAGSAGRVAVRKLTSTYTFSTANTYNATGTATTGGQLRFNPQAAVTLANQPQCMDAGPFPTVGSALTVQTCSSLSTAELFRYGSDLSLQLARPATTAAPYGLCVDSSAPSTTVTLQPCLSPGTATYNQQWIPDRYSVLAQTRPGNSRFCLYVAVGPVGNITISSTACGAVSATGVVSGNTASYVSTIAWQPTPNVGDGAAGATQNQLVNLSQFGRCAHLLNFTVPAAMAILYPCEQVTAPAQVGGYQQFSYDAPTSHWVVTKAGIQYCLTSAGLANDPVSVAICSATAPLQKWTDYGAALANQANASQWSYAARYTIVDRNGLCLSLSASAAGGYVDASTSPGTLYSKLTSQTCDGSAQQKWNADPDLKSAALKNTTER